MARPKKKSSDRYDHYVRTRCSEADYTVIKKKAVKAGLSLSEYIRQQALYGRVVVQENRLVKRTSGVGNANSKGLDFELIQQLRKIGINVNQIAKNMNIFGRESSADQQRCWTKLEQVLDMIIAQTI